MMITDPVLLKMFNMPTKKGGYTPAEMSKKFDINRYREILQDRNSDKLDIKTAEMMIKNYVIKLGALALAQESKKGFPQGIPKLSEPYMEANDITEEDLIPKKENSKGQQKSKNNNMPQKEEEEEEEEVTEMPNGEPTAQPKEEMMRYGGMRRLRRAQEGMQQPSEEEMMMMQQQQQQPQQGGQDQQMMQIMQQVAEALQQGAEPEELTVELLQGQVPPEAIAQIFVELGMPQDQVQQLVMGVMQQMQGGQEQDPRQQQMSEEEMMAMQQQDPRQMQQAPMAAYGMSMGGYDMPDYMAYGGSLYRADNGVTVGGYTAKREKNLPKAGTDNWKSGNVVGGGKNAQGVYRTTRKEGVDVKYYTGKGGGSEESVAQGICKKLQASGDIEEAIREAFPAYLKGKKEGDDGYAEAMMAAVAKLKANPLYTDCIEASTKKFETNEALYNDEVGDTPCLCKKTDGSIYKDAQGNTKAAPKDPTTGECITDDPSCYDPTTTPCVPGSDEYINKEKECTAAGKKFNGPKCDCEETPAEGCTEGTDVYNKAKAICDEKGEEFDPSICNCATTPGEKKPAEWWLQDNVNTMGAASDLASIKKYMPWEARVDLEEPRPTFLDPTRELGAQSEQANIASQASASFAGAQGLGARNAATQGNAAAQAANTLSNINNQNVNIANQFEGTQVGIRNQESMLNQQMANRVYDKNTIANQQFDNAKLQGRQNLRNAYNTAVTNKWKTDALNQMYPNYQTRPGVGGRVEYTPTDKTLDTTKRKNSYADAEEHCKDQSGNALNNCIKNYMEYNAQYGGESFEYGGYVYTVYPNY
jgi:hypothetical protein